MRKQKTGLQKDIATIFHDAIISEDDSQVNAEYDDHRQDSLIPALNTNARPEGSVGVEAHFISSESSVGVEQEAQGIDMPQDEPEPEEPWLVQLSPSTEAHEPEESFFRRFLKLFTEETPQDSADELG